MEDFEKEILNAAILSGPDHINGLDNGCKRLQLLADDEKLVAVLNCEPWKRGGAETFIASGVLLFRKEGSREFRRKVILKAYCGFGYSPEGKVKSWEARSKELSKNGIPVSRVYGVCKGVLYAEFIEWSLPKFISINPTLYAKWAASNLTMIAEALDRLRVHPICLLPDLRTDGSLIYIVDFGEDLGEVPGTEAESDYCRLLVRKELFRYGFDDIAMLYESSEI
ncbi:MAG TPA: hypothetical protein VK582_17520 [Pyrinomonadaceae bacterium]|nr:hypothetical protein [Pyrinomonadaceae bacterium]